MTKMISRVPQGWELRPLTPIPDFSAITGLSTGSAYNLAKAGKVELAKLAGRTYVKTSTIISLLASAQPYKPDTNKTSAATEARKLAAASAWQD